MGWLGDFQIGDIIYIEQCFVDGTTSAPTAIVSGSAICKRMGTLSVAPQGVGAITTSGGLCTLAIFTASSAAFFTKGDYSVLVGRGTVSGTSVVDYQLAQFSIGRTSALTYSSNVLQWNSTNVSTPATAGIPDVNVKNIDNDAASASGTVTFPAGTLPSTISTLSANVVLWQASAPNVLISGRVDANANAAIATATVSANVLQVAGQTAAAAGAVTFPGTIASSTNITSGTITTVTNLTNAPTVGDFTSTMKTSIQTAVTAVTVSADVLKWNGTLVSTPATAGIPDVNVKNIGGAVYTAATLSATVVGISTAGAIATASAAWDAVLASHLTAGTTGAALNAAGGAGDPWITPIPGAYASGTAGFLVGNLMDHTTLTVSANTLKWNGSTPNNLISGRVDANAAAVTVSTDVKSINSVSTSPVTTVKAVQGLTTADEVVTVSGNVNGNVAGSVGSVTGAVGSVTAGVTVTTNNDKTGYALSAAGNNSAADAFLLRDLATGASATDRNVQNALRPSRNKTLITTTGQLIVFQEDDTATAWTAVTTTATAQSITSIDPA